MPAARASSSARRGHRPPLVVVPGGPGFGFHYLSESLTPMFSGDDIGLFFVGSPSCAAPGLVAHDPVFEDYVAALEELRQQLQVERMDLLAHSFGGLVALRYASRHGRHVGRLVLVESDPVRFGDWAASRQVVDERRTDEERALLARLSATPGWDQRPESIEGYFRVFLRPYFGLADVADRLSFGFDAGGLAALRTAARSVRQDLGEWDLRPDARHIGAATLVMAGEASIFPARAPLELHASLRRSRLETLPGVGHFPFLEAPRTFRSLVSNFLAGAD